VTGDRYKALEGSESGHCCFEATVVDTQTPTFIGGQRYQGSDGEPKCEQICECFDMADAERIAAAMNKVKS